MTSQLHKKHLITRLNTLQTNLKPSKITRCITFGFLLYGLFLSSAASAALNWSRPNHPGMTDQSKEQVPLAKKTTNQVISKSQVIRDSHFMAAAWEEDDAQMSGLSVLQPQAFEEDAADYKELFTQNDEAIRETEDDLFDEDIELPEPDFELDQTEQAIDEEIDRRESEDKSEDFDEDDIKQELFGEDSDEEMQGTDPFDIDEDWLNKAIEDTDEKVLDKRQIEKKQDFDKRPSESEAPRASTTPFYSQELDRERIKSDKNCKEEIEEIRQEKIRDIDLNIQLEGTPGEDFPFECFLDEGKHTPRQWPELTYTWKSSSLCHKPLYFEQVRLERYGHSWGRFVQPVMSGVHFFGTIPVLPYKMGVDTPTECIYALGHYRPGNCAPYMVEPVPLSLRGALFQAGAVTGTAAIIP